MDKEKLIIRFKNKIETEYEEYIKELKLKPIDEIVNLSYQTSTKEDIKMALDNCSFLDEKQLKSLCKSPNILHQIYEEYSNYDYDYAEDVRQSTVYVSDLLIEKNKTKNIESR